MDFCCLLINFADYFTKNTASSGSKQFDTDGIPENSFLKIKYQMTKKHAKITKHVKSIFILGEFF